jgi:predicted RNA-binding protein YlxR (DUF448 family)
MMWQRISRVSRLKSSLKGYLLRVLVQLKGYSQIMPLRKRKSTGRGLVHTNLTAIPSKCYNKTKSRLPLSNFEKTS